MMISAIEQQQQHQQPFHRDSAATPEFEKKLVASSRSSSSGEEGFVSGASLPEEHIDQIAKTISSLNFGNKNSVYATYLEKPIEEFANTLLNSDRLSSEDALMAAALPQLSSSSRSYGSIGGPLSNTTNLGPHYQQQQQQQPQNPSFTNGGQFHSSMTAAQQLPGAWFYEMGPEDTGSGSASTGYPDESPMMEMLQDERLANRHTTESVEVPSSEHVAEIVGRSGCKIKALRAKTSTYIRSPPRGEEPVFLITGRPEDVMEAKREIELAAEHFTQIRASRRHSQGGCAPGHVTAYVRVPLRVVGLVVGPKGATIKRIQQESHTYIVTPSREREPIFEVTGLPQNVDTARREIEQHIYQRTGNMPITDPTASIQSYEMAALNPSNIPRMNAYSAQQQQQAQMRPHGNGYGAGNEYCGVENLYRAGLRSGLKSYSSSGSPPPYYGNEMMASQGMTGLRQQMVNNENIYNPQSWQQSQLQHQQQQHQSCNNSSRMMFNESSLFSDFLPNPRANSFGSTANYHLTSNSSTANYLSHSRDEGLGDSPSSTYTKFNPDAFHMLSSIWGDVDTLSAGNQNNNKGVETGLAPQIATA